MPGGASLLVLNNVNSCEQLDIRSVFSIGNARSSQWDLDCWSCLSSFNKHVLSLSHLFLPSFPPFVQKLQYVAGRTATTRSDVS